MTYKIIKTEEVKNLIETKNNIILLNVLPEEYFQREHIPDSKNVDGYKMNFIEELEKSKIPKDYPIIVYASDKESEASTYAAKRMVENGWNEVYDYTEGLLGWKESHLKIEGNGGSRLSLPVKKTYYILSDTSQILWTGRNRNKIHYGTLNIVEGKIEIFNKCFNNANIIIDMNSITDVDLEDQMLNKLLVTHLKSQDFFDVLKYPFAKIIIKDGSEIGEMESAVPNFKLTADLTIKDITREIIFFASVYLEDDGILKTHAHIDLDRTFWNVKYGSSKFFKNLGMHLVDNIITLDINIICK